MILTVRAKTKTIHPITYKDGPAVDFGRKLESNFKFTSIPDISAKVMFDMIMDEAKTRLSAGIVNKGESLGIIYVSLYLENENAN